MNRSTRAHLLKSCLATVGLFTCCLLANATPWLALGPGGGDARAFGEDPHDHTHLYLGTATGWIYESHDNGTSWQRLALLDKRDDFIIDKIIVDPKNPKHIVAATHVVVGDDGGIFVSDDGGLKWSEVTGMQHESVRALTYAPSDPRILVAGTLRGVYRSMDAGSTWQLISPAASREIHNIQSVAFDPSDPKVIYAGTWHLPWKTVDGGEHWENIKQGIIDDSDVFSIIVDPKDANVVYASACSGIYKSDNAGVRFAKVQGIPSTARRTRVLMQDVVNRNIVFAGTTEGLFRTKDSGKVWARTTGMDVIINDVHVDPTNPNHILLATDRGGVLLSEDGGDSFKAANEGFSARQVLAYATDRSTQGTVYVGVVNDKGAGGVFVSRNGGSAWTQVSSGLEGRDVFSLAQAGDGTMLAGTSHGVFRLQGAEWTRAVDLAPAPPVIPKGLLDKGKKSGDRVSHGQSAAKAKEVASTQDSSAAGSTNAVKNSKNPPPTAARKSHVDAPARPGQPVVLAAADAPVSKVSQGKSAATRSFEGTIYAMAPVGYVMFAATSQGLRKSENAGQTWEGLTTIDPASLQEWRYLASAGQTIVAATLRKIELSKDQGGSWNEVPLPKELKQVASICVDGRGALWVGGREGVFMSENAGVDWQVLKNLYVTDVNDIFYDPAGDRVLISSHGSPVLFQVHLTDRTVSYLDTGWSLRFVRPVSNYLIGATLFDGMVVQPKMVDSAEKTR